MFIITILCDFVLAELFWRPVERVRFCDRSRQYRRHYCRQGLSKFASLRHCVACMCRTLFTTCVVQCFCSMKQPPLTCMLLHVLWCYTHVDACRSTSLQSQLDLLILLPRALVQSKCFFATDSQFITIPLQNQWMSSVSFSLLILLTSSHALRVSFILCFWQFLTGCFMCF